MHIKINKHQLDSNVLTHGLWSKSKLGMQHIHLELLQILSYAITFKTKHISRINISNRYKIMANSPEVHLGIERPRVEVEHNLFIFCYKKHLGRFIINTK
jgi:hypothetical protein